MESCGFVKRWWYGQISGWWLVEDYDGDLGGASVRRRERMGGKGQAQAAWPAGHEGGQCSRRATS
jgi:hypothetical protein